MANVFFTESTALNLALIKKYRALGHAALALVNTEEAARKVEAAGATALWGDLAKLDTFVDAFRASDIVIHTPNVFDLDFGQYEGTVIDTIIKSLKGTNKTFIYSSNTWVLGDTGAIVVDEKTPVAPIALAAPLAKYEEQVVAAAKEGIRSIVIRSSVVYGYENDLVDTYVKHSRLDRTAYYYGSGDNYIPFVHIDDLVELYVASLTKGTAGDIYHATSGYALKSKEYAELVAKTFSIKQTQGLSLQEARAKYGALAEAYALNQQIDYTKAKTTLSWRPKHTDLALYLQELEKTLTLAV